MPTDASRLPAELLSECLRAADPPTRVRASHVSRAWRSVALSDQCLWDSFSCAEFRDDHHQEVMFDQLQTMLLRSHSLPFRLRIPHTPYGGGSPLAYYKRLLSFDNLNVHRLVLYDGPLGFFARLNRDLTPLTTLTSFSIVPPSSYKYIEMCGPFSAKGLPSLQHLDARSLSFSAGDDLYRALQHLTCSVESTGDYQRLFERCPNLVDVQLVDLYSSTVLPPVSLPRSLYSIALRPEDGKKLHARRLLRNWAGQQIPRLFLEEANSLRGVLPLFLAPDAHDIALRLHGNGEKVELITLPSDGAAARTWTITPSRLRHGFLDTLETRGCQRLTSISVPMEQLPWLLLARLETPGLQLLALPLIGKPEWPQAPAYGDHSFIRAPRLKRVVFDAGGRVDAVRAQRDKINEALGALHASFRALIVYDAELLDSITLSGAGECMREFDCAAFARFATEYAACETA